MTIMCTYTKENKKSETYPTTTTTTTTETITINSTIV